MAISRRNFIKGGLAVTGAAALGGYTDLFAKSSKVFFTDDISVEGLKKIYSKINGEIKGRVAIKLHTGEPHGPNLLPIELIKGLQAEIPNSSIVECNVLYNGPRHTAKGHRELLKTNGWTFCPVDIMDAEGEAVLPVPGIDKFLKQNPGKYSKGDHLTELSVGKNILNYDSMLVYTHFKGHASGGFGGSLKNIAIGCASGKTGKRQIHGAWERGNIFQERMAEGGLAITSRFGTHITFINVLKNLSVDCDCAGSSAAKPECPDIGILGSTDILAVDKASVDMIYAMPEKDRKSLVERIESRSGLRQLSYMKALGMGSDSYELVKV